MAVPYRQLRAQYDDATITVYQAYSEEIAVPAVAAQRLAASPAYSYTRMTWIKPSWAWMMYRASYGFKDKRQTRILAIRMQHQHFRQLLQEASVTSSANHAPMTPEAREKSVRVQWDPERDPKMIALPFRSIQIGISGRLNRKWADEWVDSIEDVTEKAHELKKTLDSEPDVTLEHLIEKDLFPIERPYEVSEELMTLLQMNPSRA